MHVAGGIALGLVWGWLAAPRLPRPPGPPVAAAGTAALGVEAALLAGEEAAVGLVLAAGAGAVFRAALGRALGARAARA